MLMPAKRQQYPHCVLMEHETLGLITVPDLNLRALYQVVVKDVVKPISEANTDIQRTSQLSATGNDKRSNHKVWNLRISSWVRKNWSTTYDGGDYQNAWTEAWRGRRRPITSWLSQRAVPVFSFSWTGRRSLSICLGRSMKRNMSAHLSLATSSSRFQLSSMVSRGQHRFIAADLGHYI
ncbi:hypothetical protein BDR22DRAFT_400317 [Usnea florida]